MKGCEHNAAYVCAACDDARHLARHPETVPSCPACRLTRVQFGSGTGVSVGNGKPVRPDPAWERGVAGEHRPGGTFMPYINPDLSKIHVKEASERRHEITDAKRRLANQPAHSG